MKTKPLLIIASLIFFTSCSSTGTGAAVGAVVGVGAGAAIAGGGGALVGGAVGATSGAIIGAAIDDDSRQSLEENNPDTLNRLDNNKPLTTQDVINLTKAGVDDKTIIAQIKATNSTFSLSAQDIIDLKNAGVSQSVINTMIKTQTAKRK